MTFAIIAGVLVFWFVLTTLVRFERGWVGLTDAQRRNLQRRAALARLTAGFQRLAEIFAEALVPVVQKAAAAIAEWGAAYERALSVEIRKMVAQARTEGTIPVPPVGDEDALERIRYAVSRYVLGVGPGDAPEEYAAVVRAMETEVAA